VFGGQHTRDHGTAFLTITTISMISESLPLSNYQIPRQFAIAITALGKPGASVLEWGSPEQWE